MKQHIKGFDTLRAFAILFVIIEHWWIPIDTDSHKNLVYWIRGLLPNGGFGVDLFFVLSGFLITSILLDAIQNNGQEKFKIIKNFIIRRALRIFPVYYLTIIILILIKYPFIQDNLWWFLLYISNIKVFETKSFNPFSHTWSLSVEEQFYLIWPWFIVFIKEKYLKHVFTIAILIGVFSSIYTMKILDNWAGFVLMTSCMQAFGIGGFYAYLIKTGGRKYFLKFISITFPVALFFHFYWSFLGTKNDYTYCIITINSIISVWLINKVVYIKSKWIKNYILENRILNKIGQISYGIYLFHFVLAFIYEKLIKLIFNQNSELETTLLDWKNSYFIRLALLFILSLISFHFFEKPILKLKNRFKY